VHEDLKEQSDRASLRGQCINSEELFHLYSAPEGSAAAAAAEFAAVGAFAGVVLA
jgi:hypothetical protein